MNRPQQPQQAETLRDWLAQANPSLLLKLILTAGAALALLIVLAWLTFGGGLASFSAIPLEPGQPVSAADEFGLAARPGLVAMQVDGVDLGSVHRLDPPAALEIDGFRLTVAQEYLNEESLLAELDLGANQVAWLENSVINYVFCLPANRGYRDILATAVSNQSLITLTTAQGNQFDFTIEAGAQETTAALAAYTRQKQPAITLLWQNGDGTEAYVLKGSYIPSIHLLDASGLGGAQVEPAQTLPEADLHVQLDGVDIQTDGLQLLVRGSVTNSVVQAGTVAAADIALLGDALRSQIVSVDPPLPWQVPAGNGVVAFTAVFQRPLSSHATLTIHAQDFALEFTDR